MAPGFHIIGVVVISAIFKYWNGSCNEIRQSTLVGKPDDGNIPFPRALCCPSVLCKRFHSGRKRYVVNGAGEI
jgi:hypothetical protein